METKEYIESISYNIIQKTARTIKKAQQLIIEPIAFANQDAVNHAVSNMGNYCDELMGKEIPRRNCSLYFNNHHKLMVYFLAQNGEINLNITLGDRFSLMTSSSKLSGGQTNFKENLEDNLKNLMDKEADRFLFVSDHISSGNNPETPVFTAEKMRMTPGSISDIPSSNDQFFNERLIETLKKIQLNEWICASSKKNENQKSSDLMKTVKKKNMFDEEISISSQETAESSETDINVAAVKGPEIISKSKKTEFFFGVENLVLEQSKKFMTFLNNFEAKNPEKLRKTFHHISKNLNRTSDDNDDLNDPERIRENKERRSDADLMNHFNADIHMESSNSVSEMKSNLSSYYDSMKKLNINSFDKIKEDHDIFVRYYNDGLKTIEETTDNLISKTDFNTKSNFQNRSAMKSAFKPIYAEDLDDTSLTLLKFIMRKCEGGKKNLGFREIVKDCDQHIKVQTFLELLKLTNNQKIEMTQENPCEFTDIFVSVTN